MHHIFEHAIPCFRILLADIKKRDKMEIILENLDVSNGNCKMKIDVIILG